MSRFLATLSAFFLTCSSSASGDEPLRRSFRGAPKESRVVTIKLRGRRGPIEWPHRWKAHPRDLKTRLDVFYGRSKEMARAAVEMVDCPSVAEAWEHRDPTGVVRVEFKCTSGSELDLSLEIWSAVVFFVQRESGFWYRGAIHFARLDEWTNEPNLERLTEDSEIEEEEASDGTNP